MFSLMRRGLNSAVFVCVWACQTGSASQEMREKWGGASGSDVAVGLSSRKTIQTRGRRRGKDAASLFSLSGEKKWSRDAKTESTMRKI